ncbi:MAG: HlyC/CorC family transporter [Clostridia bacterium]|nr:HlyC/CorC family transporter [Clostridia bacterium]MBQ7882471.1 HlyC/CorC family transporter [Treponema sp.]
MSELILLFILILANAYFAAAEIAFISLNDAKLDVQVKEGNKKAKSIKKILENPSKFLATIQIGITLAGFLSSAFASEAFASELAPVLHGWIPYLSLEVWNSISIVLITIVLSYFTLILGELVPKRIAMKYYEKIAFGTVGVIKAIATFTAPFVKFLTFSTNVVSKLFGVSETEEETVTEEEIRMMVDVGEEKGIIEKEEREMINNVFEFNDTVVSEIMVPRTEIYAVDMNLSISKVIEEITDDTDFRYSRIPVYDETIDEIKGVVYIKDILLSTKNKNVKIKNLVKEAYYVSETKPVNELFEELRKNRKQIAIVVDEYGGTAGVVTMEDILEEIVGEIYDEYDEVKMVYEKIDENTYVLNGSMSVSEVEKVLDISIPEGDYDTISGYLIEELGRIPKEKEKPIIETPSVVYKVEKTKDMRIVKIKACKVEILPDEDEEENEDNDEE